MASLSVPLPPNELMSPIRLARQRQAARFAQADRIATPLHSYSHPAASQKLGGNGSNATLLAQYGDAETTRRKYSKRADRCALPRSSARGMEGCAQGCLVSEGGSRPPGGFFSVTSSTRSSSVYLHDGLSASLGGLQAALHQLVHAEVLGHAPANDRADKGGSAGRQAERRRRHEAGGLTCRRRRPRPC